MADPISSNSNPNSDSNSDNPSPGLNTPRPTGRPVYESTLLPERRRRRFSPWLVVPGLLILLLAALYYLLFGPRPRRAVATSGRLIYTAAAPGGGSRLWSLSGTPGGAPVPLTESQDGDSQPAFSADGNQILFLNHPPGGINQVFLADADGKNRVQITRTSGAKAAPLFAPRSNTLIAYLSGPTLAVQNAGKSDASILLPARPQQSAPTDTADPNHPQNTDASVVSYSWRRSPDSDTPGLAATLETGGVETLAILPTLATEPLLTRGGDPKGLPLIAADALSCVWSPDGSHLAAALLRTSGGPGGSRISGLFLLDPLGNPQPPLFLTPPNAPIGPENPVFSPDGQWITFELWRQPDLASRVRLGLWIVPTAGGSSPRELAKGDAGGAAFSPDSSTVYFLASHPGGGHGLKRIGTDGSGLASLSDGQVDVTGFAVSPQTTDR